jgi:hypothetical protein
MEWLQAMRSAGYAFYPNQNISKSGIWYGDYIYTDLNGDGIYGNANDYDFRNTSQIPKYDFGLQAYASWNNFDVAMNWTGAAGFSIFYHTIGRNASATTYGYLISKEVANDHYFFNPDTPNDPRTNLTSKRPRLSRNSGSSQSGAASTLWLEKGDYIKLRNLTFGYTVPSHITKQVYAQNIRVYFSGENLWTITGFSGMDPEMRTGMGYTTLRQYAFGVNVTF